MRSPWANPSDPHPIGEMMDDFTENDLRAIERERDLPPDEPRRVDAHWLYAEAREFLHDAVASLKPTPHSQDADPEDAIRCAEEAINRIRATL